MTGKNISVFGMYRDRLSAEEAVHALHTAGFRNTDTAVLVQENEGSKDFGHTRGTKAPERATVCAIVGGLAGGALGWLAGAGVMAIPGLDSLTTAGPVVAALAGLGALGSLAGILGGLAGLATPEYEARRYEGRIKRAGVLLSVHCEGDSWVKRAQETLQETGAEDIGRASESSADFSISDKPIPRLHKAGFTDLTSRPAEPDCKEPEPSRQS